MDKFAADGTRNSIQISDLVNGKLPESFILGKLNETDPTKRWYVTPDKYESVNPTRTDAITEDFPSGRIERIQDGVEQFEGFIVGQDSTLAAKIASNGCADGAVFPIALDGSITGELSVDELELFPIAYNKGSLISVPVPPVEGTSVAKIQLNFQYDELVDEGRLTQLLGDDIDANLLQANGLLDGTIEVLSSPAITNSTVSVTLTYDCYQAFGRTSYIQGQDVVASWSLLDGVTPVTISDVNDVNGDGSQYDITFTSTPSSTLTLDYIGVPTSVTDQGFDVPAVTFNTPA
jgi:hypothetical protein